MKSLATFILGLGLLATPTTLAAPVEIDEIIPAANTIHSRHITISAGATLGQRHASVVRADIVRDLMKKRHDNMVAEAAASGVPLPPTDAPSLPPATGSAAPSPSPPVGTKPAGPTESKDTPGAAVPVAAVSSAAPSAVPHGIVLEAAGGNPGSQCTEANLLQCTINEWRDAEVCFVELCLN